MKLVKANDCFYLNMDLITGVWFNGNNYYASYLSSPDVIISKEAYDTILSYGKASL